MNSLEQELNNKVYPRVLNLMLCFDAWKDPENFFTMSRTERLALYTKFRPLANPPTQANFWIWFGAYGGSKHTPRYTDGPVAKLLYDALIAPIDGKRLLPIFLKTRADVNPFKYVRASGMNMQQKQIHFQNMTGTHPDVTHTQMPTGGHQALIDACLNEMDDLYCDDVIDTKKAMAEVLLRNEHSEFAIAEAFKLSTKVWK